MQPFSYSINDFGYSKEIKVDSYTIECFQKAIADDLKVGDNIIKIINPPDEQQLKNTNNKFHLDISIENCIHDINLSLSLPKNKKIQIKDGYKMRLNEIIQAIKKEGFYFSELCIKKYLKILVSKTKKTKSIFPFLGISKSDTVTIEISHDTVVIKQHKKKRFIFSSEENVSAAYKLIEETFPESHSVSIMNKHKKKLERDSNLDKKEKYEIEITYNIAICPLHEGKKSYLYFNFLPTLNDLRQAISKDVFKGKVKSKKLIIYNENKEPINDKDARLDSVQSPLNSTLYFWFKGKKQEAKKQESRTTKEKTTDSKKKEESPTLKIKFRLKAKGEKNSEKFYENIHTKSTISDVIKKITKHQKIEANVTIKDLGKSDLKPDVIVENIIDHITRKNSKGDIEYIMYVELTPKNKSDSTQKTSKHNDDDDNDNDSSKLEKAANVEDSTSHTTTNDEPNKQQVENNANDNDSCNQEAKETPQKGNENKSRKSKKQVPLSKFMPITSPVVNSSSNLEPYTKKGKRSYVFAYENQQIDLKIRDDSTLLANEEKIKSKLHINPNKDIEFIFMKNDQEEEPIQDKSQEMKTFSEGKIKVVLKIQENNQEEEEEKSYIYHYQTNQSNDVEEIGLNQDATIATMKMEIAKRNNAKASNIRILFAGKELLDTILLESLDIGDSTVFVYIRSEEDILLLTAKALQVIDYSYEIEEEEEENSN